MSVIKKIKRPFKLARARFPSSLPTSFESLGTFIEDVLNLYNLPNMPGYQSSIATMILHLGPQTTTKSKHYFALSVKKAMANQVAYELVDGFRKADKMKVDSNESGPS